MRDHVDPETWDYLRRETYQAVNERCAVCGGVGSRWPVECHELWTYHDDYQIQELTGLTGLCPACHEVKHMGLANVRGRGEIAMRHLARINGWTTRQRNAYVAEAFDIWQERSQHQWTLDLTWLEGLGIYVQSKRGLSP